MTWVAESPAPGDMIRTKSGVLYHFGIYISDEEVIQFGLAPSRRSGLQDSEVEVLSSGIEEFLAGGMLEVCRFDSEEQQNNRTRKEAITFARSKLGTKGYHILYNNCEHFATECITGTAVCRQVEDIREQFRRALRSGT